MIHAERGDRVCAIGKGDLQPKCYEAKTNLASNEVDNAYTCYILQNYTYVRKKTQPHNRGSTAGLAPSPFDFPIPQ